MMNRFTRAALCALLSGMPAIAAATDLLPVEDFARHPTLSMPRLSPDGKYLAVRWDDGSSHALIVYRVDDMSRPASMLRMPRYELPAGITWVSPTRLVIEKGKQYGSIDRPFLTGEIIATDVDGKHQDYLYGHQVQSGSRAASRGTDRGWGTVDGVPEHADGHFYMTAMPWSSPEHSYLYDVDASANTRHLIGDIGEGDMRFMIGADGQAHYAYGRNERFDYVVYHRQDGRWRPLTAQQVGGTFAPIGFAHDHRRVYAMYAPGSGPASLVEQDENGGHRKVLAAAGFGQVGGIEWTPLPRRPFATIRDSGVPQPGYIDPELPAARLHRALALTFPGQYVHFVDYSEDGGQLLFSVASDRTPGAYFLIDTHSHKVRKLFDVAPWIDPARMAERRPLRFQASDGTELEAILTLPPGRPGTHLPMVLMPHGGPIGVRDDWFYDSDAQFLASRGYLVLQVNYRGSGGRGEGFQRAGYLTWGTRIQQDLIDGVGWAVARGYADPDRVCVYGGSFGGYSALMAVIRAPGMFKCAVGYAGIYDLRMMYGKGDIRQSRSGRSYLAAVVGRDDAELDANSPAKLADKITVPVLLVHGEDDNRAPFAQARAMRAALDAAHKPYQWMSKPGEGHGFYDEKNRVDFYNALQAFLEKHIGKGA